MKMAFLLNAEVHIFLLIWCLTQQVTSQTKPSTLDMASDAYDDQYEGCVEEMEKKAPQMLEEDFRRNNTFKRIWEDAEAHWENKVKKGRSFPIGFSDLHGTAVVAYTGDIGIEFNSATRGFKTNSYQFRYFRAFHYYLTRALQLLSNGDCYNVYRGTKTKFVYSGKGSVRFGQFTSTYLNHKVAVDFSKNEGTLFVMKTCLGVKIQEFSYKTNEEEVLIPGYEVYQVKSVIAYNIINLDSPQRMKSNFNCYYSNSSSGTLEIPVLLLLLPALLAQLLLSAQSQSSPA